MVITSLTQMKKKGKQIKKNRITDTEVWLDEAAVSCSSLFNLLNPGLQSLHIGSYSLSGLDLSVLSVCKVLKSLSLPRTKLKNDDLKYILPLVGGSLRELNLANNRINSAGAKMLAEALAKSSLEILNVGNNPLKMRGLVHISESFPVTLRELNLTNLRFSYYSERKLITLVEKGTLQVLNVAHCNLGFPDPVTEMLEKSRLSDLTVSIYPFTSPSRDKFIKKLGSHPTMRQIEIVMPWLPVSLAMERSVWDLRFNTTLKKISFRGTNGNPSTVEININSDKSFWRIIGLLLNKRIQEASHFHKFSTDLVPLLVKLIQ